MNALGAKVTAGFALAGALISLIAGLAGGNPLGVILLRLLLSAVACAGLGVAVQQLLRRFVPEVLGSRTDPPAAGPGTQTAVDIVIDGDLPPVGRSAEQGAAEGSAGTEDAAGEEPDLDVLAGDAEPQGGEPAASAAGRAPAGPLEEAPDGAGPGEAGQPSWDARGQELDSLEALAELDQSGSAGARPAPGLASAGLREAARAQAERVVAGQDPADLAKAVRTFMRKDQEG